MKKILLTIGLIIVMCAVLLAGCGSQQADLSDTVKYEGKEYAFLEYPQNVLHYDYNGNSHDNFEEVDGIYPIDSEQWDMIWNGGDLYCVSDCIDEAEAYYANDDNYVWYALIDSDEEDNEINSYPVELTASELDAVYGVENKEKYFAVYFDELEKTGSLFKISKDGVVRGTLSIGKCGGAWYWRSEIIDESEEMDGTWPEYVQPLPESLSDKIIEGE